MVRFNVKYNNPIGTVVNLINPSTQANAGTGSSVAYEKFFGVFQISTKSDAPTSYVSSIRTIDLSTIFETSASNIDSTNTDWASVYTDSFKTPNLTYTATYASLNLV